MKAYLEVYQPTYYAAHKAEITRKVVDIHRRTRHARYDEMRKIKAGACVDCGQTFPWHVMDFDHRDPKTKTADVSTLVKTYVPWPSVLAEIEKCDLVCACCHRKRTYRGYKGYRSKLWRETRAILDEFKSNTPCKDCGGFFEASQMDLDHISGKTDNVSQLVGRASLERVAEEVAKCDLVCANCHRIRTYHRLDSKASRRAA